MLKKFFLKVTDKNDLLKTVGACAEIFKLAPIQKRFDIRKTKRSKKSPTTFPESFTEIQ